MIASLHRLFARAALIASLASASVACAAERPGDIGDVAELQAIAAAVAGIHDDLRSCCDNAIGERQFELCRDFNESIGSWHAIDALRDRLDAALVSANDDDALRIDIHDRAAFAVSELDRHVAYVTQRLFDGAAIPQWLLRDEIRLARKAREVVARFSVTP